MILEEGGRTIGLCYRKQFTLLDTVINDMHILDSEVGSIAPTNCDELDSGGRWGCISTCILGLER